MVVTASPDTYYHLLEYGMRKTRLRTDRLLLQAFMAGVYVGMAGHCCTTIAGSYSVDPADPLAVSKATQKLVYGMLFPVAFIAIIWTGAELFTGNTMTMLVCILEKRIKPYHLVVNWAASLFGNWLGALSVAYFLSYLTGALDEKHVAAFLFSAAKEKTSFSFVSCFSRAVGCNTFVCLAVWFVIATDDGAGRVLALWFPILAFCVGGYEHIIANFYTLQAALIAGAPVTIGSVVVKNFIPTLLGNLVGGCCLVGAVYWYNFYPTVLVRDYADCGSTTFLIHNNQIEALSVGVDVERGQAANAEGPPEASQLIGAAGGAPSSSLLAPASRGGASLRPSLCVSRVGALDCGSSAAAWMQRREQTEQTLLLLRRRHIKEPRAARRKNSQAAEGGRKEEKKAAPDWR
ncbi:hypothetical protein Efla_000294 [Eimeria flavescens]